jgi:hypothetical protein
MNIIRVFQKPFVRYDEELMRFALNNNLTLPAIDCRRGQALALMSHPDIRGKVHITRVEARAFIEAIGLWDPKNDEIQYFNKTFGLKRVKVKGVYCLEYPFKCDTTDILKRKGICVTGDRNKIINRIKKWWKDNLVNVPNSQWHIGHLDPTISDASVKNLAFQPPIQSRYRDRFKWDAAFVKMWPTTKELLPKFDKYYTDNEQREIYEALKEKFDP